MAVESWSCHACTFRHEYAAHRCTMCNALRVVGNNSNQQQPMPMQQFVNGASNPYSGKRQIMEEVDGASTAVVAELNDSAFRRNFNTNGMNRNDSGGMNNGSLNHSNRAESSHLLISPSSHIQHLPRQQQQQQQQQQPQQQLGMGGSHGEKSTVVQPMPVNNPYSTKNKQSHAGIVNNPYKKTTQQLQLQQLPRPSMEAIRVEGSIIDVPNGRQEQRQLPPKQPQQQPRQQAQQQLQQQQHNSLSRQTIPSSTEISRPGSSNTPQLFEEVRHHVRGGQQTEDRPASPHSLPGQRNPTATGNYRQGSLPFIRKEVFQAGPVPICASTQHNWIYPVDENYPERAYQLEMSHASIIQNTLVSLPTGLGKTLIAAVVMYNYYRWFPTGKVVFCAPTRPLVSQQIHACYKIMGIPEKHTAEISGRSKPDSREAMWSNKRVFFCTPQTLVKDIEEGRCDAKQIVCVVMDEAHRATGDHAYSVLVRLIDQSSAKFRLLGLSATPGTDIKSIQAVLDTLKISRIEARTESDPIVKQYIHHREEEVIVIKQPDIVKSLDRQFSELIAPILSRLREENVSQRLQYDSANLSSYVVHQAYQDYLARTHDHRLGAQFNSLRDLVGARGNLKQHGVNMARTNLEAASRKQYMNFVSRQSAFQSLMHDLAVASGTEHPEGRGSRPSDSFENNPKLIKLVEVLVEHFERKKAVGESTRAIVFSQWRDSVEEIVKMLNSQNNILLKPAQFIGQSSKKGKARSSTSGQDVQAGMNQAQQQAVLRQFGEGVFNILVCTCVGEEGLDIGEVDLIVNFDVMKSPIRSIQRNGRTGRKRNGRVVFLVAEHEEKSYQQSVTNSNKIARALKDPSVFKLSRSVPIFGVQPILLRKKMTVAAFHLSQVSGHTPKARGRNLGVKTKRVRGAAVAIQWRLEPNEEMERLNSFGQLPRSSCRDFEQFRNEFPPSVKRKYINSRNQSVYSKRQAVNVGRSSRVLRMLGEIYADVDKENDPGLSDDVYVTESIEGNIINLTEFLDSEDDCRSSNLGCEQSSFGRQSHRHDLDLDTERNSATITLDKIFAHPEICVIPGGYDFSQIAYLFDATSHNQCSVVAPPGMALRDSDEETASSALSEMSVTDDLCAFFDNTSNVELDARSNRNSFSSEAKPPNPNLGGDVDNCPDFHSYIGDSFGIDSQRADDEVSTGKVVEASIHRESTMATMSCKRSSEMNENRLISAVGNVNSRILNPVQEIEASSFERANYGPRELSKEIMNDTEIHYVITSREDHDAVDLPVLNQGDSAEDHGLDFTVCEQASSSKAECFFQLPTQNSSSSSSSSSSEGEEEYDDDQSEKSLLEVTNTIAAIEGLAGQTPPDKCLAHSQPQSNTKSVPDHMPDTPIRANESENDPATHLEDLTDTPLQRRSLGNFTDIQLDRHKNVGKLRKRLRVAQETDRANQPEVESVEEFQAPLQSHRITGHQRESLDGLTDTPLDQHRKSLDGLTDTPLEWREDVGKLRKRLRAASGRDRTIQTEAPSIEEFQAPLQNHQIEHQRESLDSLTDTPLERHNNVGKLRKRLRVAPERDRTNQHEVKSRRDAFQDMDKVRKKLEQKYRCKFLDTEAYDDSENSDDEEDFIQQIEDEEMSHDSFINDSSQLGYTQDDLDHVSADSHTDDYDNGESYHHRQINHQKDLNDFWKTPVFNRRMLKATTNESQDSESSQKGLGNMNFIRSVLDYHRTGGDADQIEEEYHHLAGSANSQVDSPIQSNHHVGLQSMNTTTTSTSTNNYDSSSIQVGLELQNQIDHAFPVVGVPADASNVAQNNQTSILTAEQRSIIEAKRSEALRRRQFRMQQKSSSAPPINPYAK